MKRIYVLGLYAALAAAQLSGEPAMFRADPGQSGVYSGEAAPSLSLVRWKFATGARIVSSPAVSGGLVYFGSADGFLYAVHEGTGQLQWKFPTRGGVHSSPAVSGGLVYFGSRDGGFYAVEAETGALRWKFQTGGERRFTAPGIHGATPSTEMMPDPYDVFLSSPAVAGGLVYFGSGDFHVYALDAASGKLRWKFATGNVVHASPAVSGGVAYIGSWDRNFYALNASDGTLLWKFETGEDPAIHNQVGIASSAALGGGNVYFGCRDGHFYALDAATGQLRWKHDNRKGWVIASPAVRGGAVYFPTSDGTRFKALDAASGALLFEIENKAVSFSSPAVAGNTAYFGSSDGWLHAVDLAAGEVIDRFQTDGSKRNSAMYTDASGKLDYAALYPDRTLDGIFVGLDRMYSLGSILSSPVVANGTVYFGSTDGTLYAVGRPRSRRIVDI